MRRVDTPEHDADSAEYVNELRTKRLGLSDTVYAQIRRYSDAAKKDQRFPISEVVAIARLVGRRPDAEEVFRSAGAHMAGLMCERISGVRRWIVHVLPAVLSRPLALRSTRRLAERYYNGTIERVGGFVVLGVTDSATVGTAPGGAGCVFYEAGLAGILERLVRAPARVEHVRCSGRGEGPCQWRADWRSSR